jgi:hypothetical protein
MERDRGSKKRRCCVLAKGETFLKRFLYAMRLSATRTKRTLMGSNELHAYVLPVDKSLGGKPTVAMAASKG